MDITSNLTGTDMSRLFTLNEKIICNSPISIGQRRTFTHKLL